MPKPLKITILIFLSAAFLLVLAQSTYAQTPISYGQIVSGTISVAGEKDEFIFSGKKDDMIIILSTNTDGDLFPYLELYDPNGAKVAESIYDIHNYKLQVTGSFKIILRDYDNTSTGNYKLALYKINNPANITAINFGQTIAGAISSLLEIDVYAFTTTVPNEKVYISLSLPPGADKYAWQSILLYDPSGKMIMPSDFAGGLIAVLPNVGTFYVVVDFGSSATGNYEVTLKHWQDPTNYTSINFGQTISGELNSFKDLKVYKFSASANDKVYISLATLSQNSEDFSPRAEIYDSSYNPIPFESIDFSSDTFLGLYTTPQSGNFFIFISDDYQNGTGTYELTLQRPNNPANVTNLDFGQTISGSIDTFTEIDVYKFTASADDIVNVRIASTSSAPDHLRPYLELYDSTGRLIADSYNFDTGSISNSITQKLSTSGTFYLFVTSWYGKGTYSLSLQRLNPAGAITLNFGQTTSGSIDTFTDIDVYKFTASANDIVTVRAAPISTTSGHFFPYLELYDSTGTLIADSFDEYSLENNSLTKKLSTSGTFYLFVTAVNVDGKGTYSLSLQRINNPVGAINLNFGQTTSGAIDAFAKMVTYQFFANANDNVYIRFAELTSTHGNHEPYLELYDSTGTLLDYSSSEILTATITTAGKLCLIVTDNNCDNTGTYELTLQRPNNPANVKEINYDSIVEDSLEVITGMNVYRFTANINDKITICLGVKAQTSEPFSFFPFLELYDTTGTRLAYSSYLSPGGLKYTFTSAGTFYLFISDLYRNATGIYRFSLLKGDVSCSSIDFVKPHVSLIKPQAGEIIEAGSIFAITWTSSDNVGITSQEIRLSTDSGITYPTVIAANLEAKVQAYNWQVPADLSTSKARIKIIAQDALDNQGEDTNEGDFMIIKTTLPNDSKDINYEYDRLNRLSKTTSIAHSLTYSYDALGNRLNLNVPVTNNSPQVGALTPSSGSIPINQPVTFTTTYADPDGWQNIRAGFLLIKPADKGANISSSYYDQNNNKLYMFDKRTRKWLGGFIPGSSDVIENSYAKLDCSQTKVSGSGSNLTITWAVSFKSTFTGTKNIYLRVTDDAGVYSGWVQKGTWLIK